jgi:hypothetical protein
MRTDADHPACVRDPAIELLFNHTATLTDERCSQPAGPSTQRTERHIVERVETTDRAICAPFAMASAAGDEFCT